MPTITTPNMNLNLPVVGQELGPAWANDNNAAFTAIDSHDHTTGNGVAIPVNGLNINGDLPFQGNNATNVGYVNFALQSAPLGATFLGLIYRVGADLYYNDGAGNAVRITQGGSVTGSAGTITGLPSGTASASYAAGTFTFQSATATPANMAVGPLVMGANVASPKTVTFGASAATPANYALTLPAAAPAAGQGLSSDGAGNLAWVANPVDTSGNFNLSAPGASTFYARISDGFADSVTLLFNQNATSDGRTWAAKTRLNGGTSEFRLAYSAGVGGNVDGNTSYTDSLVGNNLGGWVIGPPAKIGTSAYPGTLIVGSTDGVAKATGYVGNVVSNSISGQNSGASATPTTILSLTLDPGDYLVYASFTLINQNSLTASSNIFGALSGSLNSLSPIGPSGYGLVNGYIPPTPAAGLKTTLQIPPTAISVSVATTVYFNTQVTYAGTAPTWDGAIQAVRL